MADKRSPHPRDGVARACLGTGKLHQSADKTARAAWIPLARCWGSPGGMPSPSRYGEGALLVVYFDLVTA
jgi:hypothetical protein